MAYNRELEVLLDRHTKSWPGVSKRKMFGGLGYMLADKMCFGIWKENLILRLGEKQDQLVCAREWHRPFDITGKAMKGWAMMTAQGWQVSRELQTMLRTARQFVESFDGEGAGKKSRRAFRGKIHS